MTLPNRPIIVVVSILAACALIGCGERRGTEYRLSGPTMGTQFTVAVVAGPDFAKAEIQEQILAELEQIDASMSTYRVDSEVTLFNRAQSTDWFSVSTQLCDVITRSLDFSTLTDGAFDITVGTVVNIWGFGPEEAKSDLPTMEVLQTAKAATSFELLQVDCDRPAIRKDMARLRIDLSAFAKGLAADKVAGMLAANGVDNFLVDIGGDMRASGHNAAGLPWRVAIERPDGSGRAFEAVVHLSTGAVATSGDYRNFYEINGRRYSHTIDPATGRPVTHNLASATVYASTAADADALATTMMVLGPDDGLDFAEREGIAVYLLVREGDEFHERVSSLFLPLLTP